MLVLSDKLLIVLLKFIVWVEIVVVEIGVLLQVDMFSNGGMDGGVVYLIGIGVFIVVMGLVICYGYCVVLIVDCCDILQMQ